MFVIVMNQTHLVQDGSNNKLVYKFPSSVVLKDKYIAVSSVSMFYSWYNITAAAANNVIKYTLIVGSNPMEFTITIPDGIWDIKALNSFFQYSMIQNGTYFIFGSSNIYPFDISVNTNRYAIQLNTYIIPPTLPAGYTTPPNFPGLPTYYFNAQVQFPGGFNKIVGYPEDFISLQNANNLQQFPPPTASTNYASKTAEGTISYLSNTAPQVQPNSSVLFSLSNINNPYSQPSSIIYSLNSTVGIGEIISDKPPNFMWNKMIEGTYSELRLTFLGPDLQPLYINDPNMTILLTIRDKNEEFLDK
jgi:hypothetical protein